MTEFVRTQFFDSTIGVPSRYDLITVPHMQFVINLLSGLTQTRYTDFQPIGEGAASGLVLCVSFLLSNKFCSSAQDKLTGQTVAIKKILQPFSSLFHARRT